MACLPRKVNSDLGSCVKVNGRAIRQGYLLRSLACKEHDRERTLALKYSFEERADIQPSGIVLAGKPGEPEEEFRRREDGGDEHLGPNDGINRPHRPIDRRVR